MSPLSWNVAVKFLMARKFDVLRAIELFHSYRVSQRGQNPPSEGFLLCGRSLLPRITLPLLLFLSPLQVLSSWKILFPAKAGCHGDLADPNPFLSSGQQLMGCPPGWCVLPTEHFPIY